MTFTDDFWREYGSSYRVFGQFCDPDDWHGILNAVASTIADTVSELKKVDRPISVLDIGAGSGNNTFRIVQSIQKHTAKRVQLTVVEPSTTVFDCLTHELVPQEEGGCLVDAYRQVVHLPRKSRFDAIMFIHSTYYMRDFQACLKRCVEQHLGRDGVVVVVCITKDSPFFLEQEIPAYSNYSETVALAAKNLGLLVDEIPLPSRFRFPQEVHLNGPLLNAFKHFLLGGAEMDPEKFRQLFEKNLVGKRGGVDLKERLLMLRKR